MDAAPKVSVTLAPPKLARRMKKEAI